MMDAKKDFYTPQEVADLLGVKIPTVYRWIKGGRLKAAKVGQWHIPASAVNEAFAGALGEQSSPRQLP